MAMNLKSRTTITKRLPCVLALLLAGLWLAAPAFAHGGFHHVMGTVAKVAGNVLTVKTTKDNVDVKLDGKTEFVKNGQQAGIADLKVGARVIVDIPEGSKDNIAHSVKIGAAAAGHPAARK
jgi:hypothetical protein